MRFGIWQLPLGLLAVFLLNALANLLSVWMTSRSIEGDVKRSLAGDVARWRSSMAWWATEYSEFGSMAVTWAVERIVNHAAIFEGNDEDLLYDRGFPWLEQFQKNSESHRRISP